MVAYGFVQCPDCVFDTVFAQDLRYFCIMRLGKGYEEIIILVLDD